MSDESLRDQVVVKFAKKLASNESKIRNRSVKKLRNWLSLKSKSGDGFSEAELLKLWKGLHYCMWMCDKPLVQHELSTSLSKLLHVFDNFEISLRFFSAFLKTQAREWFTTDRLRLDKFMMLIRMYFHEAFVLLQNHSWQIAHIKQFNSVVTSDILPLQSDQVPDGLKFHVIGLYLEELAKVGSEEVRDGILLEMLEPFMDIVLVSKSTSLHGYTVKHIFGEILKQEEKRCLETKDAEDTEEVSDEEMDTSENDKDSPKFLQFDCETLANRLFDQASQKKCSPKNRASVYNLVKRLRAVSEGVSEDVNGVDDSSESDLSDGDEKQALHQLLKMEDGIVQAERKRKHDKKKRKKRKPKEGSDSDQEEPTKKRQKVDPVPAKKSKNKFKDPESTSAVKGKKTKSKGEKQASVSSNGVKSQSGVEKALFEGGFMSDEELTSQEDVTMEETLSPNHSVQSNKNLSSETKQGKASKKKNRNNDKTLKTTTDSDPIFETESWNTESETDAPMRITSKTSEGKMDKKKRKGNVEDNSSDIKVSNSVQFIWEQSNTENPSEHLTKESTKETPSSKSKKKNNKKKKSNESELQTIESDVVVNGLTDGESPVLNHKKKAKTKSERKSVDGLKEKTKLNDEGSKDCSSDGEVEIYIPNKKYQGKYKDWSLEQAATHTGLGTSGAKKKKKNSTLEASGASKGTPFATFDKLMQTPPAFVKKSVLKTSTPNTDPRHNRKNETDKENADSLEAKRRVSFGLHKNVAQSTKEYNDALKKTPDIPFNPSTLPETGILKFNATPKSRSATPKPGSKKGKKTRPKAADFF